MKFLALGVACLVLATAASAQVSNDECTTPINIVAGVNPTPAASGFRFTNVGATQSGWMTCGGAGKDVWFVFTPAFTAPYTFKTCTPAGFAAGSLTDSVVDVFDYCGANSLGCDDNSCGSRSSVTAYLLWGASYIVGVGSANDGPGGTFYLTVEAAVPAATNDTCAQALTVPLGASGPFNNIAATPTAGAVNCAGNGLYDLWFRYVHSLATGPVVVSTGCGQYDTVLSVYGACGGAAIACNDDTPSCPSGGSSLGFNAGQGAVYFIRVAAKAAQPGVFNLEIARGVGDDCSTATPVVMGVNGPFSNGIATPSATFTGCLGGASPDVWFSYLNTGCSQDITISSGCGGYDTVLDVYEGCGGNLIDCADDDPFCGPGGATVALTALVGRTYWIRVAPNNIGPGIFNLTIAPVTNAPLRQILWQPAGSGSLRTDIVNGAPNGGFLLAIALQHTGVAPAGPFFGIDLTLLELVSEVQPGSPFFGPLTPCGTAVVGPYVGLPPGLRFDSVAVGFNAGGSLVPASASTSMTYTVQ